MTLRLSDADLLINQQPSGQSKGPLSGIFLKVTDTKVSYKLA